MSFIAGIETAPVIARLEQNGIARDEAEDLVAACEQGFVAAKNERDEDDGNAD